MIQDRPTISPYISGLCLWAMLAVTGCGWWIPKGDPPAAYMVPPELQETIAEVTNRLHKWPDDRWWEQFQNAELNRLMEMALQDNPGLKVASARLREAQGLVRVEGARLLPFLDADASLTYERISQHGVFAALNPETAGARILLGMINPLTFGTSSISGANIARRSKRRSGMRQPKKRNWLKSDSG